MEKQQLDQRRVRCTSHKEARKEVKCTLCKDYFCPRCIISHLREKHKIDYLTHIDDASDLSKERLIKSVKLWDDEKMVMAKEKSKYLEKARKLQDGKDLNEAYEKSMQQMKKAIDEIKKARNDMAKLYLTAAKKVGEKEIDYERRCALGIEMSKKMEKETDIDEVLIGGADRLMSMSTDVGSVMIQVKKICEEIEEAAKIGKANKLDDVMSGFVNGLRRV